MKISTGSVEQVTRGLGISVLTLYQRGVFSSYGEEEVDYIERVVL